MITVLVKLSCGCEDEMVFKNDKQAKRIFKKNQYRFDAKITDANGKTREVDTFYGYRLIKN